MEDGTAGGSATVVTSAYHGLGLIVPTRDRVTMGCCGAGGGVGVAVDDMLAMQSWLAMEGDASMFWDGKFAAAWVCGATSVVEATSQTDGEGGTVVRAPAACRVDEEGVGIEATSRTLEEEGEDATSW